MSLPSALNILRRAKSALIQAEEELEEAMKSIGIKPDVGPKPIGRPYGSKNRPKTSPQPPEAEVKVG